MDETASITAIQTGGETERPAVAQVLDVSAGFGQSDVLHGVSLTLRAARVFALLGPNGAGKSSLVRLLTGTLAPRSGTVRIGSGGRPHAEAVGLVPQEIALYPWLTAKENCVAFARLDGVSAAEVKQRLPGVLRLAECDGVADVRVSHLSGGYRRRVNIAVALMSRPTLLILDEPTVGLDSMARQVVVDTIKAVRTGGMAVLIVTHDFDVAAAVADDLGFLVDGRLVGQGAPRDMLATAFGRRKLAELVFAVRPDVRQQALLRGRAAIPQATPTNWILRRPETLEADTLAESYSWAGLKVVEVRVREPTVGDLYAAVVPGETTA